MESVVHVPLRSLRLCGVILLSLWSVAAQAVGQADPAVEAKGLEAERYFNQAQELVGTADENSERQIRLLEKAVELRPDMTAAEFDLGVIYSRLHEPQKALDHFNRILARLPAGSRLGTDASFLAAVNLRVLGKPQEAQQLLQQILMVDPKQADALSLRADIYLEEGKTDVAKALFEQAVQSNPSLAEAYYKLASIAQKAGNAGQALQHYQKFVDLTPTDPGAQLSMAVLLAGEDRMEEAAKYAGRAVQLDSGNPDAWTELGKIQNLTNHRPEALQSFNHAVSLQKRWSESHRLLVALLLEGNQLAEANTILQAAEKDEPSQAEIYSLTGELATKTGDTLRALQAFGKAHELNPTAATAFDFAMAYARNGMDVLAEQYYTKALTMQDDLCEAWLNLGVVRDRQQNAPGAVEAYERAESCGAGQSNLWYRMGLLYARGGNTDKAFRYLAKAIETDPPRWKGALREAIKAVSSDLDSIRYKPEFQKLLE